jgi:Cdc6-like AAA superfamily ATPase
MAISLCESMVNEDMIDEVRKLNPFRFQEPPRQEFFIDRNNELRTTLVSCEQILDGNAGGVFVVGGRGSGKTSFLNAISWKLTAKRIPNAMITLDENMVVKGDELSLVRTILSEIFRAGKDANLIDGRIFDQVKGILEGYSLEEINLELPGINFLIKREKSNNFKKPEYIVLRDGLADFMYLLKTKGTKESRKGAIIMLDEGDHLGMNKVLLQILRNVFQNFRGVGLIVAGTTRLMDAIGEVSAPWTRFFKIIELGPYPDDETVDYAIDMPLKHAINRGAEIGRRISVVHHDFNEIIKTISGRMPFEINLLCNLAFDMAVQNAAIVENNISLYLRVDQLLINETIKQLSGTKEYSRFINDLAETERTYLALLSRMIDRATVDEMTLLVVLNELGKRLQLATIDELTAVTMNWQNHKAKIKSILESISAKSSNYNLQVVSQSVTDFAMHGVEDQMMKSYFRYGLWYNEIAYQSGTKLIIEGIRPFGNPVASIIHSIIFPSLTEWLRHDGFKAHTGLGDGFGYVPDSGRVIVGLNYIRSADGSKYHLVFQLDSAADVEAVKKKISESASMLVIMKFITSFDIVYVP